MLISILFENKRYGVIKRALIEEIILSGKITKYGAPGTPRPPSPFK
jgi:hypothetical protein